MKTIGIIGAMPSELADIRNTLKQPIIKHFSGFDFYMNGYKGNLIVNVCCGIAKVNAALCTQVLIDRFNPEYVINTGVAGGMDTSVKVCDVVISDEVLPHDLDPHFLRDYPPYCAVFKAEETLINTAETICLDNGIPCHIGRIVSGEAFVSDNELKEKIKADFKPYAVDMESSAVGHACHINDTPFVSVRCISDNADDEGAMSFDEFEKIAARRVAEIVLAMTERI